MHPMDPMEPADKKKEDLIRKGILGGEEAIRSLAKELGMPIFEDLSNFRFSPEYISKVPYSFAKKHLILPLKEEGGEIF